MPLKGEDPNTPGRHDMAATSGADTDRKEKPVPPHHEWTPYAGPVVWTGPNGERNFQPRPYRDWQLLGTGETSTEKTLNTTYISRAPADQKMSKSRQEAVGEIGWFYKNHNNSIRRSFPVVRDR